MVSKLALQADLWYNRRVKCFAPALLAIARGMGQFWIGESTMDTITPHDQNGNPLKKKCTGPCGRTLDATLENFHAAKKGKYGLYAKCKECREAYQNKPEILERKRAYDKDYRAVPENQERQRAYMQDYRTNPETREPLLAKKRDYAKRTDVKAHLKDYRKRPDVQEKSEKWRKDNPQYHKDYRKRNANRISTRMKNYRSKPETKELTRSHVLNRLARKKTIKGTHNPQQIQEQLKRQKHKCYYCSKKLQKVKGRYIYHVDHTFPISRVVGTDIPANSIDYLVLACPTCNMRKGDRFPWEFPEGGRLL